MLALFLVFAADAACDPARTRSELLRATDDLFAAFGEMDRAGLTAASAAIDAIVPCLEEPLTVGAASELHLARGLAFFAQRDAPAARASFAASRRIHPEGSLPSVVAPGNPVWKDFEALDTQELEFQDLAPPAQGELVLDGQRGLRRPVGVPVVFQAVASSGSVTLSLVLEPHAAAPSYAVAPVESEPRRSRSKPLWIGAAVLGGTAAGLGAASAWSYNDFEQGDPSSWSDRKRTRTNVLAGGAYLTGATALGLGATAFVVRGKF